MIPEDALLERSYEELEPMGLAPQSHGTL